MFLAERWSLSGDIVQTKGEERPVRIRGRAGVRLTSKEACPRALGP